MDLAQMEALIKQLRDSARQLNTTADLLETMVQPWRANHDMMSAWTRMWGNILPEKNG